MERIKIRPQSLMPLVVPRILSVNETNGACVFPSRPRPARRSTRPDTYQRLPKSLQTSNLRNAVGPCIWGKTIHRRRRDRVGSKAPYKRTGWAEKFRSTLKFRYRSAQKVRSRHQSRRLGSEQCSRSLCDLAATELLEGFPYVGKSTSLLFS